MNSERRWIPVVVLMLSAMIAAPAAARLNLRQKTFAKKHDKYLLRTVKSHTKKCGAKLPTTINWDSFKGEITKQLEGKLHVAFYSFCAEPLDVMWHLCADPDGKAAVRHNIKRYVCNFGGKGKRKLTLKKGTLTYWVDWKASNNGPFVKKFLGKKL